MNGQDTGLKSAKQLVRDFLESWSERDIERLMGFFAEDAVYHNVPVAPIVGLSKIREIFKAFLEIFDEVSLDVINCVAEQNIVFAERVDRFVLNGKYFELPVNGVFEIKSGKIIRFSDYFDLASFERESGLKL